VLSIDVLARALSNKITINFIVSIKFEHASRNSSRTEQTPIPERASGSPQVKMVVCQLHLVSLKPDVSVSCFLQTLGQGGVKPIFQARVLRWMILPKNISTGHLLARNIRWDLLLGLEADAVLPNPDETGIAAIWTVPCGVSARALSNYGRLNASLLSQARGSAGIADTITDLREPLTNGTSSSEGSSQDLELSTEWVQWMAGLPVPAREHPVSMLNLLAFAPGKKEQYKRYGTEFSRRVGSRHGGHVKLVGRVLDGCPARDDGWDEIAYVHYPSIRHFAAMAASDDYQEVNKKYRLGALKDTFILCCQEVDDGGELAAVRAGSSKL